MSSTTTDVIDGVSTSTAIKAPCRLATTANITLSGTQTIDSVVGAVDDRILVKDQTDATENGIYLMQTTAWTRAVDFDGNRDVKNGTLIKVQDGTVNGYRMFEVYTADPIVIGTSSITFRQYGPLATHTITYLSDYASLSAAVTAIGATEGTLVIDADSTVAANLTIPATLQTNHLNGNVLTINTGVTLTFNLAPIAGAYKLFTVVGTGSVVSNSGAAKVEWWGTDDDAIDAANAFSYIVEFGEGPYTITSTHFLADKGVRNSDIDARGSTWICPSTKWVAGGTLGTTEAPMLELGFNTTIVGQLFLDGQLSAGGHTNITGARFGHKQGASEPFPGIIDPSWNNHIDCLLVTNCYRGIDFISDSNSGCYYNNISKAIVEACTDGVVFRTTSGTANKANCNYIGNLFVQSCDRNVVTDGADGNTIGMLTSEGATTMNLTLADTLGFFVGGGFIENKDDAESITGLSDDGSITVVTVSTLKRANGDAVRITGTGTALDNATWTVEQVGVAGALTYKLTAGPTGLSGTGTANKNPGKNISIASTVAGVDIKAHITKIDDIDYTFSNSRAVSIMDNQDKLNLGNNYFERLEVGTSTSGSMIPGADHDLAVSDRLRVSGGQYTYRLSSGNPYYFFTSPSVPSGNETGWVFANAGGTQRFLIRRDANVGFGATAANTNTPSGATASQMAVYNGNGTLLGYVPIYAAPW